MTKERLAQLKETLDITRKLITMDIYYCIYDTDRVVLYIYPDDGNKDGIYVGSVFHDPTGKLEEVLETEKCIHNFLPMERFGFSMEGNVIPVYENGELCGAISTAYVPINQQQLAARELAVQSIYYLILSVDMKNNHCNRLYFNYEIQQFPTDAQHFDDFSEKSVPDIHPEDAERFREFTDISKVWETLQREKTITMECRMRSLTGEYRWAELIFTRIEEYGGGEVYNTAIYMVRDIHERKSKEIEILQKNQELIAQLEANNNMLFEQGMTDELTRLYNRKGLVWCGMRLLKEASGSERYIYTMVADLNGLKYINDKFGHEEGDKAIRAIANLLRQVAPEPAIVCRTGGDEFTIMTMLEKDSQLPRELETQLVKSMKDFNHASGLSYMVEVSYGWDFRPAAEIENLDDCINQADKRMYIMKSRRKVPGRYSSKAQSEILRRFGSSKQRVLILSQDKEVQDEISGLFDSGYLLLISETAEDAIRELEDSDEAAMLFVDNQMEGQTGLQFIRELPETLRKNMVVIPLLAQEDPEVIAEAFDMGVDDVLVKPYDTVLNRYHVTHMCRMSITNRKLSYMLEEREM